ncbi:unnamed protein product [Gongylonema pulchrum]|uniref:H/ACA ribonucleoprotein complex subunit n=1 Tax=Gongylonema pulchrum TaxID=637853 RepID=A0A183E6T1_9BILA|nr:unnamed protein product [Gongylonema pulchrum]
MSLSYGKMGEFVKTGEFFMVYSETPNMSEYNAEYAAKYQSNRKGSPDDDSNGQTVKRPPPPQGQFRRDNIPSKSVRSA